MNMHINNTPIVDDDRRTDALALHARAAKLVEAGRLPADYRLNCKSLGDVRRAVEGAERDQTRPTPTPSICDHMGRVKYTGGEVRSDTSAAHLGRYGY